MPENPCEACEGKGYVWTDPTSPAFPDDSKRETCRECEGTGEAPQFTVAEREAGEVAYQAAWEATARKENRYA